MQALFDEINSEINKVKLKTHLNTVIVNGLNQSLRFSTSHLRDIVEEVSKFSSNVSSSKTASGEQVKEFFTRSALKLEQVEIALSDAFMLRSLIASESALGSPDFLNIVMSNQTALIKAEFGSDIKIAQSDIKKVEELLKSQQGSIWEKLKSCGIEITAGNYKSNYGDKEISFYGDKETYFELKQAKDSVGDKETSFELKHAKDSITELSNMFTECAQNKTPHGKDSYGKMAATMSKAFKAAHNAYVESNIERAGLASILDAMNNIRALPEFTNLIYDIHTLLRESSGEKEVKSCISDHLNSLAKARLQSGQDNWEILAEKTGVKAFIEELESTENILKDLQNDFKLLIQHSEELEDGLEDSNVEGEDMLLSLSLPEESISAALGFDHLTISEEGAQPVGQCGDSYSS